MKSNRGWVVVPARNWELLVEERKREPFINGFIENPGFNDNLAVCGRSGAVCYWTFAFMFCTYLLHRVVCIKAGVLPPLWSLAGRRLRVTVVLAPCFWET